MRALRSELVVYQMQLISKFLAYLWNCSGSMKAMSIEFDGHGSGMMGGVAQIALSLARLRPFGTGGRKTEDVACRLAKIPAG